MKKVLIILLFFVVFCDAKKPSGLQNLGNTCYQNASLQCLMNIQSLSNYMLYNEDCFYLVDDKGNSTVAQEYIHLIRNFNASSSVYKPEAFCARAFQDLQLPEYAQQDAHEFVSLFLDRIGDVNIKPACKINGQSIIQDMLFPIIKSSSSAVDCPSMNKFSFSREGVIPLQLSASLEESLNEYTSIEQIEYRCEETNEKIIINKIMNFYSAPEIFIFSLKRFYQSFNVPPYKINNPLRIPLQLDLRSYFSEDSPVKDSARYELIGVTVHSGAFGGGHYWAYVKDEDGNWYNANDSSVTPIAQKDIDKLQSQGYLNSEQETPYILYYKRMDGLPAGININLNTLRASKPSQIPHTEEALNKYLQSWGLSEEIFDEYLLKKAQTINDVLNDLKKDFINIDSLMLEVNAIKKEQESILGLFGYSEDLLKSQLNDDGISSDDIEFYLNSSGITMNDIIDRVKKGSFSYTSFLATIKKFKEDQEAAAGQVLNFNSPARALAHLEVELSALKDAASL